jgi:RHS repeat-associated protein
VATITDADGNTTHFFYDALNRQTSSYDQLGHTTATTYDAAGRVATITDADHRRQVFTYDAADRVTGVTWLSSTGATVNQLFYTYDANGNVLTAGDDNGTYVNTYDAQNRLATQTDPLGLTLAYAYDAAGRVIQREDSLGGVLNYYYDNANRLISEQFGGTGQTQARVDLSYDNRNELTLLTRYADVAASVLVGTTAYSYDAAGRVTAITNKNASAAPLSYYDYTYDNADRVTSEAWQSVTATGTLSDTHTYSYDATSQLTADGSTAYSYDANGNRTMTGYQTGTNNQITNDGVFAYTYDDMGDVIEKSKGYGLETWYYGYDTLNRLTSIRETSDGTTNVYTVAYTYDVMGNRSVEDVWQAGVGETITRTAFDGGQAWADLTSANAVTTRYVWGAGPQDLYARIDVGAGLRQISQDRLGSVRDVWDGSGVALDHIEYAAYGAISSETAAALGGHYLYTGLTEDRTAHTLQAFFRTEFVDIGRWAQPDPITFTAGDGNIERYVANDPTNATDPSGLSGRGRGYSAAENTRSWYAFWDSVADSTLENIVSVPADLIRAGQAGVWNASGGTPYVPDWHSRFAQNAPLQADKEASEKYMWDHQIENAEDGAILLATAGAGKVLGKVGGRLLGKAATVGAESLLEDAAAQGKSAVYREILSDANGRLLSRTERNGVKFTVRRVEELGYDVSGSVKYSGNQGIDLVFEGKGPIAGRIGLAEAKASRGLGSLAVDTQGIRQGSYRFFETRLQRGGRLDLLGLLQSGNADLFGGFSGSGRLYQFNPTIFFEDVNFKATPGAAILVP